MTAPDPRLGEIEARLNAANPLGSEWEALTDPGDRKTAPAWIVDADDLEIRLDATYAAGKVAYFIAAAPADVAYLLAELRKRDEMVMGLKAALDVASAARKVMIRRVREAHAAVAAGTGGGEQ